MRDPTNEISRRFLGKIFDLNLPLLTLSIMLGIMGVLMQYSAGGGSMEPWGDPQLMRLFGGMLIMLVIAFLPQHLIYSYTYYLFGIGVFLLIVVEIFGHIGMGAQRWVKIGFVNIQPSEPMKLFLILALAKYFHNQNLEDVTRRFVPFVPLLMIAVPAALILHQPNLGTAAILSATGVAILFTSGVRFAFFATCLAAFLALAPVGWNFLHDYQKQRVMTFLDPEADPLGSGYNIMQSKIAIGSGGTMGKGFLQGTQSQLSFLPEKQTDFVFTMIAEEMGLFGGLLTIIMFTLFILLAMWIGISSKNHFGRIIASGVSFMIFIHLFINVGMVMGILPVVGVPLPFISYGGTMQLTTYAATGLLLNVWLNRASFLKRSSMEMFG